MSLVVCFSNSAKTLVAPAAPNCAMYVRFFSLFLSSIALLWQNLQNYIKLYKCTAVWKAKERIGDLYESVKWNQSSYIIMFEEKKKVKAYNQRQLNNYLNNVFFFSILHNFSAIGAKMIANQCINIFSMKKYRKNAANAN